MARCEIENSDFLFQNLYTMEKKYLPSNVCSFTLRNVILGGQVLELLCLRKLSQHGDSLQHHGQLTLNYSTVNALANRNSLISLSVVMKVNLTMIS